MSELHSNLLELLILCLPTIATCSPTIRQNDISVIVVNYFKVVVRDI